MAHAVSRNQLAYQQFINRENQYRHHYYDEEMLQYDLLKKGDMRAVEEARKMFSSTTTGHLSDDPVRNYKYLFVASITLATRFAIEGGMNAERAYDVSDLYIYRMDHCQTVDEIKALQQDMFALFTSEVRDAKKENIYSRPVRETMDYIYEHLNETITMEALSAKTGLTRTYLSELFKKEVHLTITQYIRRCRVEAAQNMLIYSHFSYSEISACLAFCSQSYFSKIFKDETGFTPAQYRRRFFRTSFEGNSAGESHSQDESLSEDSPLSEPSPKTADSDHD